MFDPLFGTTLNSTASDIKQTLSESCLTINSLPSEMLRKIFQKLEFEDLMNVMLVSRYWRTLGGDPFLWRKYPYLSINNPADLVEKLSIPRLAKLEEVCLMEGGKYKDCHINFLSGTEVRTIWLGGADMTDVSPDIIATFLNQCESIFFEEDVFDIHLTDDQNFRIIELMSKKTSLKNCFVQCDVDNVSPDTLAMAVSKIENVTLSPTPEQMIALFTMMSKTSKVLHLQLTVDRINILSPIDLSPLPNSVFCLAITRLISLTVTLDKDKLTSLMLSITREETNITSLDLCDSDLSQVKAGVLARGLARLETVKLDNTRMDTKQVLELCREMVKDYSVIKTIYLKHDLTEIPADLLVKAFNKLETMGIVGCEITEEQTKEIFKQMSLNTKIRRISGLTEPLTMCGLRRVSECTLAKAVNKLNWAKIVIGEADNQISLEQLLAILQHASVQTSLVVLKIALSAGSCDIPTDLVQAAKRNIKFFYINEY